MQGAQIKIHNKTIDAYKNIMPRNLEDKSYRSSILETEANVSNKLINKIRAIYIPGDSRDCL